MGQVHPNARRRAGVEDSTSGLSANGQRWTESGFRSAHFTTSKGATLSPVGHLLPVIAAVGVLLIAVESGLGTTNRVGPVARTNLRRLHDHIGRRYSIWGTCSRQEPWLHASSRGHTRLRPRPDHGLVYPFFRAYHDLSPVFDGVLASSNNLAAGLRPPGSRGVEIGKVGYVSGGYFQVLGIGPAAGRVITVSDDTAGGPPVVVLSYRYWQRQFKGDLRVVGQKFSVNNVSFLIAGVAEKGFGGLFKGDEPEVFVALAMYPVTNPGAAQEWNKPQNPWLTCVARLKPGLSMQQAQASMPALWRQAVEKVNDRGIEVVTKALGKGECRLAPVARSPYFVHNEISLDPLKAMAAATVLVLLLTCANAANLLLVRASQRWKQTAGVCRWARRAGA